MLFFKLDYLCILGQRKSSIVNVRIRSILGLGPCAVILPAAHSALEWLNHTRIEFTCLVMHHPAVEEIKYEDTLPLPLDKPATAEELGRKLLKAENIQGSFAQNLKTFQTSA